MTPHRSSATGGLSRRQVLVGGAAGVVAPVLLGIGAAPTNAAELPLVKPIPSNKVYQSFGVNAMPNNLKSIYRYTDHWLDALKSTGACYFRGAYAPGLPATLQIIARSRDLGLRWGMSVANQPDTTVEEIVAAIRHIAANGADRCLYIEGVNEPNYVRATGETPSGWMDATITKQRAIWDTVQSLPALSHVKVLGPSLQDVVATEADYQGLADRGLLRLMDVAAMHRYPGGRYPSWLMDERLARIGRTWPGKPTWITELGYSNALATTSGHKPITEAYTAGYGPAALLEAADRSCNIAWFELLDDVDPGAKDELESNFGMFATQGTSMAPPWRAKPVVASIRSFLRSLQDPGPGFSTTKIPLLVSSEAADLRATVTAKRDGSAAVHLRRATNAWDPKTQRAVYVAPAPVVVQHRYGKNTVQVDHRVTTVRV